MESIISKVGSGYSETAIYKLANDIKDDETKTDAVYAGDAEGVTLLVEAGANVSGGVIRLEGAASEDYAGTWMSLGQVTTNAASTAFACSAGLAPVAANGVSLPMPFVRARIETAVAGGGTVDIYLIVKS